MVIIRREKMDKRRRTSIFGGAILILVGGLLFAAQIMPDLVPDFFFRIIITADSGYFTIIF